MNNRPQGPNHCRVSTPRVGATMGILGSSCSFEGVHFSRDEHRAMTKLYGFYKEPKQQRPPEPPLPGPESYYHGEDRAEWQARKLAHDKWKKWQDPSNYLQAGADLNMSRRAREDGLRLIAWLARYVEPGEDPLKALIQAAAEVGWAAETSVEGIRPQPEGHRFVS